MGIKKEIKDLLGIQTELKDVASGVKKLISINKEEENKINQVFANVFGEKKDFVNLLNQSKKELLDSLNYLNDNVFDLLITFFDENNELDKKNKKVLLMKICHVLGYDESNFDQLFNALNNDQITQSCFNINYLFNIYEINEQIQKLRNKKNELEKRITQKEQENVIIEDEEEEKEKELTVVQLKEQLSELEKQLNNLPQNEFKDFKDFIAKVAKIIDDQISKNRVKKIEKKIFEDAKSLYERKKIFKNKDLSQVFKENQLSFTLANIKQVYQIHLKKDEYNIATKIEDFIFEKLKYNGEALQLKKIDFTHILPKKRKIITYFFSNLRVVQDQKQIFNTLKNAFNACYLKFNLKEEDIADLLSSFDNSENQPNELETLKTYIKKFNKEESILDNPTDLLQFIIEQKSLFTNNLNDNLAKILGIFLCFVDSNISYKLLSQRTMNRFITKLDDIVNEFNNLNEEKLVNFFKEEIFTENNDEQLEKKLKEFIKPTIESIYFVLDSTDNAIYHIKNGRFMNKFYQKNIVLAQKVQNEQYNDEQLKQYLELIEQSEAYDNIWLLFFIYCQDSTIPDQTANIIAEKIAHTLNLSLQFLYVIRSKHLLNRLMFLPYEQLTRILNLPNKKYKNNNNQKSPNQLTINDDVDINRFNNPNIKKYQLRELQQTFEEQKKITAATTKLKLTFYGATQKKNPDSEYKFDETNGCYDKNQINFITNEDEKTQIYINDLAYQNRLEKEIKLTLTEKGEKYRDGIIPNNYQFNKDSNAFYYRGRFVEDELLYKKNKIYQQKVKIAQLKKEDEKEKLIDYLKSSTTDIYQMEFLKNCWFLYQLKTKAETPDDIKLIAYYYLLDELDIDDLSNSVIKALEIDDFDDFTDDKMSNIYLRAYDEQSSVKDTNRNDEKKLTDYLKNNHPMLQKKALHNSHLLLKILIKDEEEPNKTLEFIRRIICRDLGINYATFETLLSCVQKTPVLLDFKEESGVSGITRLVGELGSIELNLAIKIASKLQQSKKREQEIKQHLIDNKISNPTFVFNNIFSLFEYIQSNPDNKHIVVLILIRIFELFSDYDQFEFVDVYKKIKIAPEEEVLKNFNIALTETDSIENFCVKFINLNHEKNDFFNLHFFIENEKKSHDKKNQAEKELKDYLANLKLVPNIAFDNAWSLLEVLVKNYRADDQVNNQIYQLMLNRIFDLLDIDVNHKQLTSQILTKLKQILNSKGESKPIIDAFQDLFDFKVKNEALEKTVVPKLTKAKEEMQESVKKLIVDYLQKQNFSADDFDNVWSLLKVFTNNYQTDDQVNNQIYQLMLNRIFNLLNVADYFIIDINSNKNDDAELLKKILNLKSFLNFENFEGDKNEIKKIFNEAFAMSNEKQDQVINQLLADKQKVDQKNKAAAAEAKKVAMKVAAEAKKEAEKKMIVEKERNDRLTLINFLIDNNQALAFDNAYALLKIIVDTKINDENVIKIIQAKIISLLGINQDEFKILLDILRVNPVLLDFKYNKETRMLDIKNALQEAKVEDLKFIDTLNSYKDEQAKVDQFFKSNNAIPQHVFINAWLLLKYLFENSTIQQNKELYSFICDRIKTLLGNCFSVDKLLEYGQKNDSKIKLAFEEESVQEILDVLELILTNVQKLPEVKEKITQAFQEAQNQELKSKIQVKSKCLIM